VRQSDGNQASVPTLTERRQLENVSRRWLLQVGSGVGLAALINACTSQQASEPASETAAKMSPSRAATTSPSSSAAAMATTEATALPSPSSIASSAPMLCREAWGARPARPGGTPQVPNRMTVHHSAVVLGANSNAPARIRADQRYHQDSKGWIDIAYHMGVDRNGNIYELRNPELVGDTATTYDPTGHFLVLCEGDYDQETVTEDMLNGVARACAWAAQRYSISPERLAGHKDFAATSCPGANLYAHIASGDIKSRIQNLVAAGGGGLERACGPEAAARVAAIEAGN